MSWYHLSLRLLSQTAAIRSLFQLTISDHFDVWTIASLPEKVSFQPFVQNFQIRNLIIWRVLCESHSVIDGNCRKCQATENYSLCYSASGWEIINNLLLQATNSSWFLVLLAAALSCSFKFRSSNFGVRSKTYMKSIKILTGKKFLLERLFKTF